MIVNEDFSSSNLKKKKYCVQIFLLQYRIITFIKERVTEFNQQISSKMTFLYFSLLDSLKLERGNFDIKTRYMRKRMTHAH